MKNNILIILLTCLSLTCNAQKNDSFIKWDKTLKSVSLSDSSRSLSFLIKCEQGCQIEDLKINGNQVISNGNSVFTGFTRGKQLFSSANSSSSPVINLSKNVVTISNIRFGEGTLGIEESWVFTILKKSIQWQIKRDYLNDGTMDQNFLPVWRFNSMQTWDGAVLSNGGVAWCRFLEKENFTYGVHAAGITLWNRGNNDCFRISPVISESIFPAVSFSHSTNDLFEVVQTYSNSEFTPKYGLRRFVETGNDVFTPVAVKKSTVKIAYRLEALNYNEAYDRGTLRGINEGSVNEILNTIARYSVVDQYLYGSNGWRTGFAVLQEQWLALFGLAIDDPGYIIGYSQTLEYERDHAIQSDGRVLPRWHHDSGDAMRDTFTKDGYYECQWGYMLDSQPAYVIDVAEQFDMNGDKIWLKKFKTSCERALEYLIRRDSDGNGLFEVKQSSHLEGKGTDWLDVVWASYEVASINALIYKALIRWSELEVLLGDQKMADRYLALAKKLKTAYNKNIADGGFWNPEKQWYVHWREKDGSVYGNNLVSMVNFMAIGYGVCDNPIRKEAILSKIEELTRKENLFIWPACYFPYEENVGLKNVNYPWPNYENGDMFLGWAELGTRCYCEKDPEIAIKYIKNVIAQYEKDGLAHQRYKRISQSGDGEDILANNAMAIVGLYRNIYGIRPQFNRLYLEPHITAELNGTEVRYNLRNKNYLIGLNVDKTIVSVGGFSVSSLAPFGVNPNRNVIEVFFGSESKPTFRAKSAKGCIIELSGKSDSKISWKQSSGKGNTKVEYMVSRLNPQKSYTVLINNEVIKTPKPNGTGELSFVCEGNNSGIVIKTE